MINYAMLAIMIVCGVVEICLVVQFLYNLIRYKYVGNKWVYVIICFFLCLIYCGYLNNPTNEKFDAIRFGGSLYDAFKTTIGKIDSDKVKAYLESNTFDKVFGFSFIFTAYLSLAFLSVSVVMGKVKAIKNAIGNFFRNHFKKGPVYYIFTDSKDEMGIALASELIKNGEAVSVYVSKGSLKTQDGTEFKDLLLSKKLEVKSEGYSSNLFEKLFKRHFDKYFAKIFRSDREAYIYSCFSNDETTVSVANHIQTAIRKNKNFIKHYGPVLEQFEANKDNIDYSKLDAKDVETLKRYKVFITYQNADLDILHNYSANTLHIMNALSKYDMISSKFLLDNPISSLVDISSLNSKKDNNAMHVTMLGFGKINKPIFEKMTYSYQLFGDNINKIHYHILDREAESLIKGYENEFTNNNSELVLYTIDAGCDGEDLTSYQTIDNYIKETLNDETRFQKDGFEVFIVSVVNSNNDLAIAKNLRNAILKYYDEEAAKRCVIYVRIEESYIQKRFANEIKSNIINSIEEEPLFKNEKVAPFSIFGDNALMINFIENDFDFIMDNGFNVWASYMPKEDGVSDEEYNKILNINWMHLNKDEVLNNTYYVYSIKTKLSILGLSVDKNFKLTQEVNLNFDELFSKEKFFKYDIDNEAIVKLANLEHNRWSQACYMHYHYGVLSFDDCCAISEKKEKLRTKNSTNTKHVCMVTNKKLIEFYNYLVNKDAKFESAAYKLVYFNDISQIKLIVENLK